MKKNKLYKIKIFAEKVPDFKFSIYLMNLSENVTDTKSAFPFCMYDIKTNFCFRDEN